MITQERAQKLLERIPVGHVVCDYLHPEEAQYVREEATQHQLSHQEVLKRIAEGLNHGS